MGVFNNYEDFTIHFGGFQSKSCVSDENLLVSNKNIWGSPIKSSGSPMKIYAQ